MSGQTPWLIECEVFLFTHEIMDNFGFNIRWHFARYLHKIEISGGHRKNVPNRYTQHLDTGNATWLCCL